MKAFVRANPREKDVIGEVEIIVLGRRTAGKWKGKNREIFSETMSKNFFETHISTQEGIESISDFVIILNYIYRCSEMLIIKLYLHFFNNTS